MLDAQKQILESEKIIHALEVTRVYFEGELLELDRIEAGPLAYRYVSIAEVRTSLAPDLTQL